MFGIARILRSYLFEYGGERVKKAATVILLIIAVTAFLGFDGRRLVIAGSTGMGKMMTELTEEYSSESGISAQAQLGGTQLGLIALKSGSCDVASVSRPLTDDEKVWAKEYPIATDVISVIVNPQNEVNGITMSQLRGIYSGSITNWEQLGGEKIPIVVIGREAGSGTRTAFEEAVKIESADHDQEHSETGMLRTAVAMTRGAVGYISFDFVNDDVKMLAIDGVSPCRKSVIFGEYPITRSFSLCIRQGESRTEVFGFVNWCIGDKGQMIIERLGMMPIYEGNSHAL